MTVRGRALLVPTDKGEKRMNNFTYSYPVKVCFGDGVAKDSLKAELQKYGKNILFAYGGGAIKRVGIYDEIIAVLNECGKSVTEFSGIMSNPTYTKVQEGARLAKENKVDFILAVGGGSVIDAVRSYRRRQSSIRIFGILNTNNTARRLNLSPWERS